MRPYPAFLPHEILFKCDSALHWSHVSVWLLVNSFQLVIDFLHAGQRGGRLSLSQTRNGWSDGPLMVMLQKFSSSPPFGVRHTLVEHPTKLISCRNFSPTKNISLFWFSNGPNSPIAPRDFMSDALSKSNCFVLPEWSINFPMLIMFPEAILFESRVYLAVVR